MENLPDEIAHHVFDYLEIADIMRLSSASHQMNMMVKRYHKPLLLESLPNKGIYYRDGSVLRYWLLNYKTYSITDLNDFIFMFVFANNLTKINVSRKVKDIESLLDIMIKYSTRIAFRPIQLSFETDVPWSRIPANKIKKIYKLIPNIQVSKNICQRRCNIHKPINLHNYKEVCSECWRDSVVSNSEKLGPNCEECAILCGCNNYAIDDCNKCGGFMCGQCCAQGECISCQERDLILM
jgi:hypothetical protein